MSAISAPKVKTLDEPLWDRPTRAQNLQKRIQKEWGDVESASVCSGLAVGNGVDRLVESDAAERLSRSYRLLKYRQFGMGSLHLKVSPGVELPAPTLGRSARLNLRDPNSLLTLLHLIHRSDARTNKWQRAQRDAAGRIQTRWTAKQSFDVLQRGEAAKVALTACTLVFPQRKHSGAHEVLLQRKVASRGAVDGIVITLGSYAGSSGSIGDEMQDFKTRFAARVPRLWTAPDKQNSHFFDAWVARLLLTIHQGAELPEPTDIPRHEWDEFVAYLCALYACLFVAEGLRRPAALLVHLMAIELMAEGELLGAKKLTWKRFFTEAMPLAATGSVAVARWLNEHLCWKRGDETVSYFNPGPTTKGETQAVTLLEKESAIIRAWRDSVQKSKEDDAKSSALTSFRVPRLKQLEVEAAHPDHLMRAYFCNRYELKEPVAAVEP